MNEYINRQKAVELIRSLEKKEAFHPADCHKNAEIIRCKDCKHNPKLEWFGCPMSHMSEKQRPETAWCWKGERKDNE